MQIQKTENTINNLINSGKAIPFDVSRDKGLVLKGIRNKNLIKYISIVGATTLVSGIIGGSIGASKDFDKNAKAEFDEFKKKSDIEFEKAKNKSRDDYEKFKKNSEDNFKKSNDEHKKEFEEKKKEFNKNFEKRHDELNKAMNSLKKTMEQNNNDDIGDFFKSNESKKTDNITKTQDDISKDLDDLIDSLNDSWNPNNIIIGESIIFNEAKETKKGTIIGGTLGSLIGAGGGFALIKYLESHLNYTVFKLGKLNILSVYANNAFSKCYAICTSRDKSKLILKKINLLSKK